jgi:ATP-dependent RNA helicase RhlE
MLNTKNTFESLGIKDSILKVVSSLGLETPTPIQEKAIPPALEGLDVIGIAQTGTGKTLAFAIPMLERLAVSKGRGLVVVPTRELASQVSESIKRIGTPFGLKTAVLIGGEPVHRQIFLLKKRPHIVIATPGRLIDHLKRKSFSLDNVKMIVLDEADMMFDLGFAPQMEEILKKAPKDRQTMLFSATMPTEITKLADKHLKLPISIEVAPQGTTAETVNQELIVLKSTNRFACLQDVISKYQGSILVFVRTKHGVTDVAKRLKANSCSVDEIHSNLSQRRRQTTLASFRSGKTRILIATDVAARGLDIKGIELVVNYNLPDTHSDYVHRIGRTGRAGVKGQAISFATPDQFKDVNAIEKLINKKLTLRKSDYSEKLESKGMTKGKRNSVNYKKRKRKDSGSRDQTKSTYSKPNQKSAARSKNKHKGHNNYGRKFKAKRFARNK